MADHDWRTYHAPYPVLHHAAAFNSSLFLYQILNPQEAYPFIESPLPARRTGLFALTLHQFPAHLELLRRPPPIRRSLQYVELLYKIIAQVVIRYQMR